MLVIALQLTLCGAVALVESETNQSADRITNGGQDINLVTTRPLRHDRYDTTAATQRYGTNGAGVASQMKFSASPQPVSCQRLESRS